MEHTFTVTVTSDSDRGELAEDILFLLEQTRGGYIGNPDEHPLYESTSVVVA